MSKKNEIEKPKSKGFIKETYDKGKTEPFFPHFILKEWMVAAVFLIGMLVLAATHPAPLQRIADPTDTSYTPLPDWYFLFLYQFLKYSFASGPYMIIGLILPGVALVALFLAPFLDRGKERSPLKRPVATGIMVLSVCSIVYLTWLSVVTHDWEAIRKQGEIIDPSSLVPIDKASNEYKILEASSCTACHGADLNGTPAGGTLINMKLSVDEIIKVTNEGVGPMAGGLISSGDEVKAVSEFLFNLKSK